MHLIVIDAMESSDHERQQRLLRWIQDHENSLIPLGPDLTYRILRDCTGMTRTEVQQAFADLLSQKELTIIVSIDGIYVRQTAEDVREALQKFSS